MPVMVRLLFCSSLLVAPAAVADQADLGGRIDAAITRGVDFLLAAQNPNGSWGGATRTKGLNIYAPVPGAHHAFRAGCTGLAFSGLLDARDPRPEVQAAIGKGGEWFAGHLPTLRRADATAIYNLWGHAYGLRALTRLYQHDADPGRKALWKELAQEQVGLVNRYSDLVGGWGYYDMFDEVSTRVPSGSPTSFTTATILLAMHEAREVMGVVLDDKVVNAALKTIWMQRKPDFSYAYHLELRMRPMHDVNRPAGSLSRSQTCNAALRVFGDEKITDEALRLCLDRFLAREGFLHDTRKRPVPHEGPFQIAGYFYYYGIFYFSEAASLLPAGQQPKYAAALAETILPLQEPDGSWWDYPLYDYHQSYGTGFALMALAWCRDALNAQASTTN